MRVSLTLTIVVTELYRGLLGDSTGNDKLLSRLKCRRKTFAFQKKIVLACESRSNVMKACMHTLFLYGVFTKILPQLCTVSRISAVPDKKIFFCGRVVDS